MLADKKRDKELTLITITRLLTTLWSASVQSVMSLLHLFISTYANIYIHIKHLFCFAFFANPLPEAT